MARGKNKKSSQAEKVLTVLLSGNEVTMAEIEATLGAEIEVYRISTYLWNLKKIGAEIKKIKTGRKLTGFQLVNVDKMKKYVADRAAQAVVGATPAATKSTTVAKSVADKAPELVTA